MQEHHFISNKKKYYKKEKGDEAKTFSNVCKI